VTRPLHRPLHKAPIRTARLTLTPLAVTDAGVLLGLLRAPAVRRYLLDDEEVGPAFVRQVIEDSDAAFATGGAGLFLARDEAGATVGLAGFRSFFEPPELQLLYALHPSRQGQGYATEMGRALIDLAFDELGFAEVRASTDAPNQSSVRVLERLSMSLVRREPGPRHETLHYALQKPRG
jgi:[ribosomal protein S5]-alanine N-acetyltransferase